MGGGGWGVVGKVGGGLEVDIVVETRVGRERLRMRMWRWGGRRIIWFSLTGFYRGRLV